MLLFSWWESFVDLIEWGLISIADFTGNGGLAIILFTILIKTVLLPLTIKSVKSTAAMQELQPKIKELQKKYGKDRQRLSQETMQLYSQYNINPAAGCLPLLLQMPIFFGLFFAIRRSSESGEGTFAEGFLWIANLAESDQFSIGPIPIATLAILAGIFQFVQMRMMRPRNQGKVTDPQQAMMQMMMNFMPLMVVIFGWNFPAGVVLYWATQSIYSVVQQWFITGWGAVGDWAPWLPELPEHRRLGHRKPSTANVVLSGEPVEQRGVMGWMQRQAKQMEEKQAERNTTRPKRAGATEANMQAEEPADMELHEPEVPDGVVRVRARGGKVKRTGGKAVQGASTNDNGSVASNDTGNERRPKPTPRRARRGKQGSTGD